MTRILVICYDLHTVRPIRDTMYVRARRFREVELSGCNQA